ncbi:hypothetical protein U0070_022840 [Myodes glareolus]|uniref:Uncharacterized protein n=1 Tax=Myodes glareolus TaxID=447135 RepID=A0AAW0K8P7_MYOGA
MRAEQPGTDKWPPTTSQDSLGTSSIISGLRSNLKTTVLATQTAKGKQPGGRYLHVHESEVDPFLLHQLPVTSLLHDDAVLKPGDDVCISDRRQSMSDHNGGSPFPSLKGKRTNLGYTGVMVQTLSINRHTQALGRRWLSFLYLLHGYIATAIANVLSDRGSKQYRLLTHHPDDFPQVPHIEVPDVLPVNANLEGRKISYSLPELGNLALPTYRTLCGVVEPLQQLDSGALPTATVADQGHRLSALHLQVEALQDLQEKARQNTLHNTAPKREQFNTRGNEEVRKCGEPPQCRQRREGWGGAVVTNALSLAPGLVKPAQGTLVLSSAVNAAFIQQSCVRGGSQGTTSHTLGTAERQSLQQQEGPVPQGDAMLRCREPQDGADGHDHQCELPSSEEPHYEACKKRGYCLKEHSNLVTNSFTDFGDFPQSARTECVISSSDVTLTTHLLCQARIEFSSALDVEPAHFLSEDGVKKMLSDLPYLSASCQSPERNLDVGSNKDSATQSRVEDKKFKFILNLNCVRVDCQECSRSTVPVTARFPMLRCEELLRYC